jgi:sulfotransferase family protein
LILREVGAQLRHVGERMKEAKGYRLPDFIAVGPPRTGTTWLDRVFRGRVGLPAGIKETQFFVWRYSLGIEWYAAHFRDSSAAVPAGEFAPTYFAVAQARERIARHMPGCKIICTLRDPVERFYSHYKMWRKIGMVKASFEYVVERHKELLGYTRYAFHVKAWQEQFGYDNTLVLIHEDALSDRQAYIDRICAFIGASPIDLKTVPREQERLLNVRRAPKSWRLARRATYVRDLLERFRFPRTVVLLGPLFEFSMGRGAEFAPLSPEMEARLRHLFRTEIEQLEDMLGRDLSIWKRNAQKAAKNA